MTTVNTQASDPIFEVKIGRRTYKITERKFIENSENIVQYRCTLASNCKIKSDRIVFNDCILSYAKVVGDKEAWTLTIPLNNTCLIFLGDKWQVIP